ncbi:hypothetical protein HPP92_007999 [Vanilla planifolia]|uniref:Surfeit locus protein 2 n=1 Tax=Vanilla planifolia TaxID=51239 RepID=A0A835RFA5_VANPL|nr:hypothetical protein HPP92_007999 [Vanilla planifolia]
MVKTDCAKWAKGMEADAMEIDGAERSANPISGTGESKEEEGRFLLGLPTFVDIGNGRLRCEETGHELLAKDKDSYSRNKSCRLGLINSALANKKPPLNTFLPHPLLKSKLVCSLTGDTINKSEVHIWKHINGRRFLKKLEEKEVKGVQSPQKLEKDVKSKMQTKLKAACIKKDLKDKASLLHHPVSSDSEDPNYWVPPTGHRWDCDDGNDRWENNTSDRETEDTCFVDEMDEKKEIESIDLSVRTKRMAAAAGPCQFAKRKKKKNKTDS